MLSIAPGIAYDMCLSNQIRKVTLGTYLTVQWLRLDAFTAWARGQSLVWKRRSCKLHGTANKKKKKKVTLIKPCHEVRFSK